MGLLDFFSGGDDANSQAQMAAEMALLQAGGPSRTPTSFGQALSGAMAAGQGAAQNFKDRQIAEEMRKAQLAHQALIAENMGLDIKSKKTANDQAEAQKRAFMNFTRQQSAAPTAQTQAMPDQSMNEEMSQLGAAGAPMGSMQQPQQAMGGQMQAGGGFNKTNPIQAQIQRLNAMADYQEQTEGISGEAFRKQAIELMGKLPKVKDWSKVTVGGQVMLAPYFDDGSHGQPVPLDVAEKLGVHSIGGQTIFTNDYTGKTMRSIENTQTKDSMAGNAVTMRGQNMTDARAREQMSQTQENATRPVWNHDVGAFIVPPDEKNPNGRKIELTGYAKPDKPLTETQAKAVTFASRMSNANNTIDKLTLDNVKNSGGIKRFAEGTGNMLGLGTESVGGALSNTFGAMTNWTQSDQQQQFEQAKRDWTNANLRNESGAAIGKSEFESADKQYFPQVGDSAEVIRQKGINRKIAEEGMRTQAGEGEKKINSIIKTSNAVGKPRSIIAKVDGGGSVAAQLAPDGNYYVVKNGKKYRVDE